MKNILKITDSFEEIGTRTIDERNRLTVGEILKDCKRIRLYRNDSGEILLQPIAEIPASELWLFQNPEAINDVREGLRDASQGKVSRLDPEELKIAITPHPLLLEKQGDSAPIFSALRKTLNCKTT